MKFSIIVAAYNVADYLRTCVESLAGQIFSPTEYEILLIDDGSTDNRTGQLCDELSKLASNIRVIHKPNGGVSSVRNLGIEEASGDYILFIDGDDFWSDQNFLSGLSQLTKNQEDIVVFPYTFYSENKQSSITFPMEDCFNQPMCELAESLVYNNIWGVPCWNKCVKRSIIVSKGLIFPSDFLSGEDTIWSASLLKIAKTCSIYNNPQYQYRQNRDGSITNVVKAKNVLDILRSIDVVLAEIDQLKQVVQEALILYATIAYVSILPYAGPYRQETQIATYLKSYRYLLNNSYRLKQLSFKLTGLGARILGLNLSMSLYQLLLNVYRKAR